MDRIFSIIEKYTVIFVTVVSFVLIVIYSDTNFIQLLFDFLLVEKEGTIVNIASIFIGIYFSMFGILGAIRTDSILANVSTNTLSNLIKYLYSALFSSFIYVPITLLISNHFTDSIWYSKFEIFLLTLIIFMFSSSARLIIFMCIIVAKDFSKITDRIENDRRNENKLNNTIVKLDNYLERIENERHIERSNQLRRDSTGQNEE